MTVFKFMTTVACSTVLAASFSLSANANSNAFTPNHSQNYYSNSPSYVFRYNPTVDSRTFGTNQPYATLHNGSETATKYYRKGIRQFEKGNLIRAKEHFNAVLLANGLNQEAHYYLGKINFLQGDKVQARKHALLMHGIKE